MGNVSGVAGDSGAAGYWEFIYTGYNRTITPHYYLIRQKQWPNWYIYMENNPTGNVRGQYGKPGQQGEWQIDIAPPIDIDGELVSTFDIRPRQWPGWRMVMKDDSTANVEGQPITDPGLGIAFKRVPQY